MGLKFTLISLFFFSFIGLPALGMDKETKSTNQEQEKQQLALTTYPHVQWDVIKNKLLQGQSVEITSLIVTPELPDNLKVICGNSEEIQNCPSLIDIIKSLAIKQVAKNTKTADLHYKTYESSLNLSELFDTIVKQKKEKLKGQFKDEIIKENEKELLQYFKQKVILANKSELINDLKDDVYNKHTTELDNRAYKKEWFFKRYFGPFYTTSLLGACALSFWARPFIEETAKSWFENFSWRDTFSSFLDLFSHKS